MEWIQGKYALQKRRRIDPLLMGQDDAVGVGHGRHFDQCVRDDVED